MRLKDPQPPRPAFAVDDVPLVVGIVGLVSLMAMAACRAPACPEGLPPAPVSSEAPVRIVLRTALDGLSGLDLASDGRLFAVAERTRQILPLALDGRPGNPIALHGLPDGVDTESLAWLSDGRLVLGLEGQGEGPVVVNGRACDLAVMAPAPSGLTLTDCHAFPYARFGLSPRRNRGIEGVCRAGRLLVAASEDMQVREGRRITPLAVMDILRGSTRIFYLGLTSTEAENGKISALDCQPEAEGTIRLRAIERHFGVRRILSAVIPGRGEGQVLDAQVELDLQASVPDRTNPEGLALLPDGRLAVINDNHYHTRQGDSVLLLFHKNRRP